MWRRVCIRILTYTYLYSSHWNAIIQKMEWKGCERLRLAQTVCWIKCGANSNDLRFFSSFFFFLSFIRCWLSDSTVAIAIGIVVVAASLVSFLSIKMDFSLVFVGDLVMFYGENTHLLPSASYIFLNIYHVLLRKRYGWMTGWLAEWLDCHGCVCMILREQQLYRNVPTTYTRKERHWNLLTFQWRSEFPRVSHTK